MVKVSKSIDAESAIRAGKKARAERWSREAIFVGSAALVDGGGRCFAPSLWTAAARRNPETSASYLRVVPISLNTVLTLVPTVWTAVIMKTAMSEAISAYSIAVTPDWSAAKAFIDLNIGLLLLRNPIRHPGSPAVGMGGEARVARFRPR